MSLTGSFFVWITSFIVFVLIMFAAYKISYKLGIKKALYRTTYILLSVIFAFVLAPLVNNFIFDLDLSKFGVSLQYKDQTFYTLIDYIEEVIVYSDLLNDLYLYFPSLKDLLMDFPQILLAPIVYVVLFVILFALVKSGLCDVLATVLPLLFVRPILFVADFFRKPGEVKS